MDSLFHLGFLITVSCEDCPDSDFWMYSALLNTFQPIQWYFKVIYCFPITSYVKSWHFEVFSLVKALVRNSFSIVAFFVPSDMITPLFHLPDFP